MTPSAVIMVRNDSPAASPPCTPASAALTVSMLRRFAIPNTVVAARFPIPAFPRISASASCGTRSLLSITSNAVGSGAGLADDVHVELEVLPQASSLLPLVAKQLRDREPADRLFQGLGPRAHDARERRGHLGAQRDLAATLVLEGVQLLHDLRTALLGIELQRLERRAVVLLEAVAPRHLAPGGENRVPESKVFRVKVAKAREGLSLHRNNLGDRREAGQAGERVPDGVERAGDDHGLRVLLHQLERALEVALEGVCGAERAELALDATQAFWC